jgi:multiple sugar transport system permease protein
MPAGGTESRERKRTIMTTLPEVQESRPAAVPFFERGLVRNLTSTAGITLLGLVVMLLFLMPLGYMLATGFKPDSQISAQDAPLWPAKAATFNYEGEDYPLYNVPTDEGMKRLALVKPHRENSEMVDPANPAAGIFTVQGRWRTWTAQYTFSPTIENFVTAWRQVNFPQLFRNTFVIAILSTIGTLLSCILVAYGFARFRFPGKNLLFIILLSTIMLPPQATIIPLYIFFAKIGWTGTWLPLIVPAFFANAFDVFLLRQYFMTIPRDMDEAAMIDGANPLRTLISVIIPQSIPAITAVALFHFFFAWNDYFSPLVYLIGKENLYPISVGIGRFVQQFGNYPGRAAATAALTLILPALIFFFAQRQFMQGVVVTGVEK